MLVASLAVIALLIGFGSVSWVEAAPSAVENQPPVAGNDSYTTFKETPVTIPAPGVLSNDSDPDGDPLTATKFSEPSHGGAVLVADGTLTYSPASGFIGVDSFDYEACDPAAVVCAIATVTISVTAAESQPPVPLEDYYTTSVDTPLSVPAPGVLFNDSDPDGDSLTAVLVHDAPNGTVSVALDGSFTYTPDPGFHGLDGFAYNTCDADTCILAQVQILVTAGPNQPPVAIEDAYFTPRDAALTVLAPGVLANDFDPEANSLYASENTDASHGTVNDGGTIDGSFTYTPNSGFVGEDSFTYLLCSYFPGEVCVYGTVTVTVIAIPTAVNDVATTSQDIPVDIDVLANDIDLNPGTIVTDVGAPAHGSASLTSPPGTITYTPDPGFVGTDSFTYAFLTQAILSVSGDVTAASNSATVTVTVLAPSDPTPTPPTDPTATPPGEPTPSPTASIEPTDPTPTPVSPTATAPAAGTGVVSLPNTGSGNGSGGGLLAPAALLVLALLGGVAAMMTLGRSRVRSRPRRL